MSTGKLGRVRPVEPAVGQAAGRSVGRSAEQDAAEAADAARVVIGPATSVADLRAVADLFALIWQAPTVAPMPHDLMRSLAHAGGAVHAAYRDGELAGASVAVFSPPRAAACYSLIAGVSPAAASRGVGYALKLAQRAWALEAGATSMTWTYDPLLRRNAHFNLVRLGARVTEYLEDFYGEIADGVNDPETDRVAVTWDLASDLPAAGRGGQAAAAGPAILSAGPGAEPVLSALPGAGSAGPVRCWIPDDVLALRRADPALARRWRLALREALGGALSRGWRVAGLARPGWYALEQVEAAG